MRQSIQTVFFRYQFYHFCLTVSTSQLRKVFERTLTKLVTQDSDEQNFLPEQSVRQHEIVGKHFSQTSLLDIFRFSTTFDDSKDQDSASTLTYKKHLIRHRILVKKPSGYSVKGDLLLSSIIPNRSNE